MIKIIKQELNISPYLKKKITSGKSFVESPFKETNVIHVKEFGERNKMKKLIKN